MMEMDNMSLKHIIRNMMINVFLKNVIDLEKIPLSISSPSFICLAFFWVQACWSR